MNEIITIIGALGSIISAAALVVTICFYWKQTKALQDQVRLLKDQTESLKKQTEELTKKPEINLDIDLTALGY